MNNFGGPYNEPVQYISLGEVPSYMERVLSIQRSRQTVYNWTLKGVSRGLGQQVYLKSVKQAGKLMTTRQWVRDFIDEVSEIEELNS